MKRDFTRTKNPGIYAGTLPGLKPDRYKVYYRLSGSGQRTKTFLKVKDALAFQGKARDPHERRVLRDLEAGKVALANYLPLYMDAKRRWRKSTRERMGYASRLILDSRLARLQLLNITRSDIDAWVDEVLEAGARPGSYEKAFALLRACLAQATREGKIRSNPATGIELPPREKRAAFPMTASQVRAVAAEVPARYRSLVLVLGFLGVRVSEAAGLRVSDIDLEDMHLSIERASGEVSGRLVEGPTKTASSRRVIPLPKAFATLLQEHIDRFCAKTEDGKSDPSALVFTHESGARLRQSNWRARIFQPACIKAGITRTTNGKVQVPRVHDLRHSASSIAAGLMRPHEVQALLGHTSIATTMGTYVHAFADEQRKALAPLGALTENPKVIALRGRRAG
jgi:integrase